MPLFVVQRHHATNLHFDFRLEIDGVLVSWALPKGPTLDPEIKRLAVRTGDHELDHAYREGRLSPRRPQDPVGRGTVIVWDIGEFSARSDPDSDSGSDPVDLPAALRRGHLSLELAGSKLTGGVALIHTGLGGIDRNWLMIKSDDDGADPGFDPARHRLESVLSGKSNEDLD